MSNISSNQKEYTRTVQFKMKDEHKQCTGWMAHTNRYQNWKRRNMKTVSVTSLKLHSILLKLNQRV